MIGLPPFEVGAVQVTIAYPSPDDADTDAGADGSVIGVLTARA